MASSNTYSQLLKWQEAHNICIGDQINFWHKGRSRSGYLTGFDLENNPLKLIVRYINRFGRMQVALIDRQAVVSKQVLSQLA